MQRGEVLSDSSGGATEADGCTACDQPFLDHARCAFVTFPLAPHPSCIQFSFSGCYIQYIYSLYFVWTKLQTAPQQSHRSPTCDVNNFHLTGRADANPESVICSQAQQVALKKNKNQVSLKCSCLLAKAHH